MHRMFTPLCHAERSEASRSLTLRVLIARNEILRFLRSLRMTLAKNLPFRVSPSIVSSQGFLSYADSSASSFRSRKLVVRTNYDSRV